MEVESQWASWHSTYTPSILFVQGKVSFELELIGTPAPSSKYEKLSNKEKVETCLGRVADIL